MNSVHRDHRVVSVKKIGQMERRAGRFVDGVQKNKFVMALRLDPGGRGPLYDLAVPVDSDYRIVEFDCPAIFKLHKIDQLGVTNCRAF